MRVSDRQRSSRLELHKIQNSCQIRWQGFRRGVGARHGRPYSDWPPIRPSWGATPCWPDAATSPGGARPLGREARGESLSVALPVGKALRRPRGRSTARRLYRPDVCSACLVVKATQGARPWGQAGLRHVLPFRGMEGNERQPCRIEAVGSKRASIFSFPVPENARTVGVGSCPVNAALECIDSRACTFGPDVASRARGHPPVPGCALVAAVAGPRESRWRARPVGNAHAGSSSRPRPECRCEGSAGALSGGDARWGSSCRGLRGCREPQGPSRPRLSADRPWRGPGGRPCFPKQSDIPGTTRLCPWMSRQREGLARGMPGKPPATPSGLGRRPPGLGGTPGPRNPRVILSFRKGRFWRMAWDVLLVRTVGSLTLSILRRRRALR